MAFLDNPTIILAHIRQSHVTSDDTGMCEMVLIDHDVDLEKFNPSSAHGDNGAEPQGSNGDTQGYVYSQSVDITSSWDFGIRRRSNTGAWRWQQCSSNAAAMQQHWPLISSLPQSGLHGQTRAGLAWCLSNFFCNVETLL